LLKACTSGNGYSPWRLSGDKIEMAAGKSVGNKVMTTPKTRRKSKGKKRCEYIGEFVWLSYIVLVLCLIGLGGAKAENFGEWVLEQRGGSFIFTLSFKQSASVNNQLATSELALICDQRHRSTSIGVMLIPFDGTFESHRDPVPILIQKNSDQYDRTDIIQNWRNGNEFLFLDGKDDVAELVTLLKERDSTSEKSVHFDFPNDVDSGPPSTNHIVVDVSGFSDGFGAFEKACAKVQ
jgi:hypothetical protein